MVGLESLTSLNKSYSRYFGKRLGVKKNSSDLEPMTPNVIPLVWRNSQQLSEDLGQTQHIEGVNAVLEVCCCSISVHRF
jgi:hypothetical protein